VGYGHLEDAQIRLLEAALYSAAIPATGSGSLQPPPLRIGIKMPPFRFKSLPILVSTLKLGYILVNVVEM